MLSEKLLHSVKRFLNGEEPEQVIIKIENLEQYSEIKKYESAIANTIALKEEACGILLITNGLDASGGTLDFRLDDYSVKVVLPAPVSTPLSYGGIFYKIQNGSILPLNLDDFDKLRFNYLSEDFTFIPLKEIELEDLDKTVINSAKEGFKSRFLHLEREVESWKEEEFLNKLGLLNNGNITFGAYILFGKKSSSNKLQFDAPKISWILKDETGNEIGFQHYFVPFYSIPKQIEDRLAKLTYDYSEDTDYVSQKALKCGRKEVIELIWNAITYNNYRISSEIKIMEKDDSIEIYNYSLSSQIAPEHLLNSDIPRRNQNNYALRNALFLCNKTDNLGAGIKKVYEAQRLKKFPMPDIELVNSSIFKIKLYGKVINKRYTELLNNNELSLKDAVLLDKVQKGRKLNQIEFDLLRAKKLVSGTINSTTFYTKRNEIESREVVLKKEKTYTTDELKELVKEYLAKVGTASRSQIDTLLLDKFPKELPENKRRTKIKNLLFSMSRKDFTIINQGSATKPIWALKK